MAWLSHFILKNRHLKGQGQSTHIVTFMLGFEFVKLFFLEILLQPETSTNILTDGHPVLTNRANKQIIIYKRAKLNQNVNSYRRYNTCQSFRNFFRTFTEPYTSSLFRILSEPQIDIEHNEPFPNPFMMPVESANFQ